MTNNISFSGKIKDYLLSRTMSEIGMTPKKKKGEFQNLSINSCCIKSFLYGALLYSKRFDRESLTLTFENEKLLEICTFILIKQMLQNPRIRNRSKNGKGIFEVQIKKDLAGLDIYDMANANANIDSIFVDGECKKMFLRGAFLSSGNVSITKSDMRVEMVIRDLYFAKSICDTTSGIGIKSRISRRRNDFVVYIKGSSAVEDFLTTIGAEKFALDIMERNMERQLMNDVNRTCNCESANMKKTVNASVVLRGAIKKLREEGRFDSLPPELKEVAILREDNPDLSLSALLELMSEPVSRSGLNHRMKKIIEISNEEQGGRNG